MPLARRPRAALAACISVSLLLLAGAAPTLAAPPAPVLVAAQAHGLIVRLKGAAAHASTEADDTPRQRPTRDDGARWRAVLRGAALGATSGQREPALRAVGRDQQLLDFGRGLAPAEAERLAERLRRSPEVDWVALNVREQRLQVSSDPYAAQQWWLQPAGGGNANALADRLRGVPGFVGAWQSGIPGATGGAAAIVAVLDTGITAHPDLAGRTLPGYDFVSELHFAGDGDGRDNDPTDPGDWVSASDRADTRFADCELSKSTWHGTIVAGIIAAATDNGVGVAGINQQGRVLPVRVAGKCGATVADIVDGMRWAAGLPVAGVPTNPNPARIVNISFGGSAACGLAYQTTVDELRAHGVVVVAAAGNEHGAVSRPASCSGVVGVAALNRDGFKSHYSNFGEALGATGVATVGGDDSGEGAWRLLLADNGLVTVWNSGETGPGSAGYAAVFGTSFATPLVSGTLALMLSVNPALSAEQLISGLRVTARPHVTSPQIGACSPANPGRCICSAQSCGAGILDASQAVLFAANPGSYVAPARQAALLDNPEITQAAALGPDRPGTDTVLVQAPRDSGGGGGGALGGGWVAALAAAVLLLRASRRTA
jgi:serine protease